MGAATRTTRVAGIVLAYAAVNVAIGIAQVLVGRGPR